MAAEKKIYGDRYQILSLIGEGGMACVYSALDTKLDRKVALKLLHPHLAKNQDIRDRFYGEARAISVLNHPNILKIYDFSGEDSEDLWLVTEILTGKTLDEFTRKFPGNKLHPIIATCIVKEITKALIEAHSKRIVHRDIKPENVMILKNGQIKLMDFGIAKNLKKMSMTVTGTFMGSPSYMSPEQIKGVDIDHRTDLYSLGVVFYELLTGELPYQGNTTHEVILKITQADLIPPKDIEPSIPEDLNAMVVKLLSKDPDDRYKKAKNLALDLDTFLVLNGFAESHIELERYFANKKKFEKRLNEFVLSGWNLGSNDTVNARENLKTKKMAVVREVKTIILGENEVQKRVESYNDNSILSQSRNFEEISSKSLEGKTLNNRNKYISESRYSGNDLILQESNGRNLSNNAEISNERMNSNGSGNSYTNNYNYYNYNNNNYNKGYNNGWNLKNPKHNNYNKNKQDLLVEYYYKKSTQQSNFYLIGILIVFIMIALFIFGYFALQNKLDNTLLNNKIDEIRKIEMNKDRDKEKKETKKDNKKDTKKEKKNKTKKDVKKDSGQPKIKVESISTKSSTKPNTNKKDDNYSSYKKTNVNKNTNNDTNRYRNTTKTNVRVSDFSSQRYINPPVKNTTPSKEVAPVKTTIPSNGPKKKVSYNNSVSTSAKKIDAKGFVVISSQPAADIYINGVKRGTTIDRTSDSGSISLNTGSYSVELRREGYHSYFTSVRVGSGETKRIFGKLRRRD